MHWSRTTRTRKTLIETRPAQITGDRLGLISEDPIGFAAGDTNVARYVGNGVTGAVDPSGLESYISPSVFGQKYSGMTPHDDLRNNRVDSAAATNGLLQSIVGIFRPNNEIELMSVNDADREQYELSLMAHRSVSEFMIGYMLGVAARAAGVIGKAALTLDLTSNTTQVVEGVRTGNPLQVVGGAAGLSGNASAFIPDNVRAVPRSGNAAHIADEDAFATARTYEVNPKHGPEPRVERGEFIGQRPTNPQDVLDQSLPIGPNTSRRIGYDPDTEEIVIFDRDRDWWDRADDGEQLKIGGMYHGHVRPWDMLNPKMKRALIEAGLFNNRGRYIGP